MLCVCTSVYMVHAVCYSFWAIQLWGDWFCLFCPQKNDKWSKMMSVDENMVIINDFLEKGDARVLVIYLNQQSQLTPINSFPSSTKQKVLCMYALEHRSQSY